MHSRKKRVIALVLSIIIVGAGQLYRKRWATGIIFLFIALSSALFFKIVWSGFTYWFLAVLFAWIVLWMVNIIDAYKGPFYETSPCEDACPSGIRASDYVTLIADNRFDEAYKIIVGTTPFVATLGRVCPAPCEQKCSRSGIDSSVAIRYLKRVVAECVQIPEVSPRQVGKVRSQKKVAIIGGGPCGLTCAYELMRKGYEVSVFEKEKDAGGMLTLCVPEYRLPLDIVKQEIDFIEKSGVEIKTNIEVGKDTSLEEIEREYDAIFISTGASISQHLNIPGENLMGVYYGIDFLKSAKSEQSLELRDLVIVIGGGNVAIDAARSAKRLGARDVKIFYRRILDVMPAFRDTVEAAKKEGIEFHFLSLPVSISGSSGRVSKITFVKTKLEHNRVVPLPATEFEVDIDCVIIAIGEKTEISFVGIDTYENGTVIVDKHMSTSKHGVFAGGDVVTGPATVVDAIASGKIAAASIDRYLRGWEAKLSKWFEFYERPNIRKVDGAAWLEKGPRQRERLEIPLLKDRSSFNEVEISCPEENAVEEAKRCLMCHHRFWW